MTILKYLAGYSPATLEKVQTLIDANQLADVLLKRYHSIHDVRTDQALYHYTQAIKTRFMGKTQPLNRVHYDSKIKVIQHALGQHHYISRLHGGKQKTVNEIKIASLFRRVPEAFLKMIVVHELAHFKEKEHNKAFYNLCCHMEPQYHQYEFDLRLYLTQRDLFGDIYT